ncbi:RrF2 family transcriptional regulator [Tardiphaga sp. 20_F10_N6_6]|uniref:RrF2 family transcriptional regulator n=1 Tax=Tardiphaga TaxID=1395974 RepID=UPI001585D4BB|nr:Rrf2 family transcriptional regulator [Tardiphaga robiniae]NUU44213.1 Rrf2 family transcriptional regulator [Tardiphaga robiniae]
MRRDNRLSATLHALLHMAEQNRPMTSAELAMCMTTNAVVVRRTMAGLREAGLVRSEKGHGGGWEIARDLATVTLKDIYDALGKPSLMAMGIHLESPTCLVEQAVNRSLTSAFAEAEAVLIGRLADVTLAQLAADFHARAEDHRSKIQSKISRKTK